MDFSIIILFIIISIIGNIIKESRKQQRSGKDTSTAFPNANKKKAFFGEYKPPKRNAGYDMRPNRPQYGVPGYVKDPGPDVGRTVNKIEEQLNNEGLSMEGRRMDIGRTYESKVMPSSTPERTSLEGNSMENVEVTHFSYEQTGNSQSGQETYDYDYDYDSDGKKNNNERYQTAIKLDQKSLINGIILSEVLAPPKCKR